MCRLFGLTAGTTPVRATFWLLDAPDSLAVQSHRNVDGSGIGFFGRDGEPVLDKQPEPAFADAEFSRQARQAESATFVAHVRWATAGGRTVANTHPFALRGLVMAHNGGFGEMGRLDEQLGRYGALVRGDTDSERYFALIIQQADACGGDVAAGLAAAARWIAEHLPVSSLNAVLAAPDQLWALRYPDQHALHVIERPAGSSDTPAGSGETRADPGDTPAGSGETRADPGDTPAGSGETRADPGDTPAGSGETRADPGDTPAGSGETRADPGDTPAGSGETRADPGDTPAGSGETRADPGDTPAGRGDTPGGPDVSSAGPGLHVRSATSSVHVPALHAAPSVVVASERMDGESGWRMLAPGELLHVRPDLSVSSAVVIDTPPRRLVPLPRGNPNIDT